MKLKENDVRLIRADSRSLNQIARDYGVALTTIRNIKRRRTWRHVPQMPWYPNVSEIESEIQESDVYCEMDRYRPTCYDAQYDRQMRQMAQEMLEYGSVRARETEVAIMTAQFTDVYVHEMRRGDELWYVWFPQEVWRLDASVNNLARRRDRAKERHDQAPNDERALAVFNAAQKRLDDMLDRRGDATARHKSAIVELPHGEMRDFFDESGIRYTNVYHGLIAHPTPAQLLHIKLRVS